MLKDIHPCKLTSNCFFILAVLNFYYPINMFVFFLLGIMWRGLDVEIKEKEEEIDNNKEEQKE